MRSGVEVNPFRTGRLSGQSLSFAQPPPGNRQLTAYSSPRVRSDDFPQRLSPLSSPTPTPYHVLPGSAGVLAAWTSCLLFFQVALLAGYAYAHALISRVRVRRQIAIHIALLAAALATLPIIPSPAWKPVDPSLPVWAHHFHAVGGHARAAMVCTFPPPRPSYKRGLARPHWSIALSAGAFQRRLAGLVELSGSGRAGTFSANRCTARSIAFAGFAILCAAAQFRCAFLRVQPISFRGVGFSTRAGDNQSDEPLLFDDISHLSIARTGSKPVPRETFF